MHFRFKGGRRVLQSDRYPYKLVHAELTDKSGRFAVAFVGFNSPVPGAHIQGSEDASSFQGVNAPVYLKKQIRVSGCYGN